MPSSPPYGSLAILHSKMDGPGRCGQFPRNVQCIHLCVWNAFFSFVPQVAQQLLSIIPFYLYCLLCK